MIELRELCKRYGGRTAVDGLSFRVPPGRVTGFLGPNGAGKSTTMRMIVGLDRPTAGSATVCGKAYREFPAPLREVGTLLEPGAVQGGRTAFHHLLWLAYSNGIGERGVREALERVGLGDAGRRKVGGFSLGMTQRLGIAAALLGDPGVVLLDEPINGLDTEGIRWLRGLLRELAGEGRTVLLSSHVMSEMELVADHLIVIGKGRLVSDSPLREFIERYSRASTTLRSPDGERFCAVLRSRGAAVHETGNERYVVEGPDAVTVGSWAAEHGVTLYELTPRHASLEEIYTELTRDEGEYTAKGAA
ncbi:ATP-binding cassette domain-containing protein [Actinocorallia populi]|uniref:ATP-binding cassette domain-containing protein n=1 Tax=Actinocorallia populi TaxID=2079200 RepID=UPI000D08FBED|nr:ATP-binding cassette domain-containing protein [Actinocorallia populi]